MQWNHQTMKIRVYREFIKSLKFRPILIIKYVLLLAFGDKLENFEDQM